MTSIRPRRAVGLLAAAAALVLTASACSAGSSVTPSTTGDAGTTSASTPDPSTTESSATSDTTSSDPSETSTPTGSPSTEAPSDTALVAGFILEPTSLDFTTTDGAAIPQVLLDNVYETLLTVDQDGALVPRLAEKWEVSDDGLTYTFTLRTGVTFSDGAEFGADDVKFSLDRVSTDWSVAVAGAMDLVKSTNVVDPATVEVMLNRPSNSWLYALTTRVGAIFDTDGVADLANTPIGTGPYTFAEWNRGDSIVLERNPDYWGQAPAVKTVTFKYFKDASAMNSAMLTGGIDIVTTMQSPETLGQFADTAKYQVIEGATYGEVMMTINNGKAPLDDVRVRQAINYALDKEGLLQAAWAGHGTLIGSHVSPLDPWYVDLTDKYPYDPEKAKQLLAEAGQSDLTLSLKLPPPGYAKAAAPIIISQLSEVGIEVVATEVTFPVWLDEVFGKADYDLTIINHVEPRDMATIWGNPDYYTRYDNATVRELLTEADAGTPEQFVADYQQAAEILADDAAAVWLWSFPNLMVADVGISGLPVNAVGESFPVASLSVD